MEPRIQYAKTSDGVNIAYWTLGKGMPFVQMPAAPVIPTQRAWRMSEGRRWYERLAGRRQLIRYDNRGCGLSERDVSDCSLDARVLDLEAVIDRLTLDKIALFGYWQSGPVAITYAVRHPERVSHLLLWCTSARGRDLYREEIAQALREVANKDWRFFVQMMSQDAFGWSGGEHARQATADILEGVTGETIQEALEATLKDDVTDLLPQIRSPTLVLHRRGLALPRADAARGLAAGIPESRLALLEGASIAPYVGDTDAVMQAIDEFLGDEGVTTTPDVPAAFRTILFTDMEGSTSLTQRLGDAAAQEVLHTHNSIVRDALTSHGGTEIKHTGDGIMASFTSASAALEAAVAIQKALADHNEGNPDTAIRVRIGLNAGEPIAEDEDLFGTAVNMAARICAKADSGQILAPIVVRELVAGKGFLLSDVGETELRGFEDPVRLFEVRWSE